MLLLAHAQQSSQPFELKALSNTFSQVINSFQQYFVIIM